MTIEQIAEYMQSELQNLESKMEKETFGTASYKAESDRYYYFRMICNDLGIIK